MQNSDSIQPAITRTLGAALVGTAVTIVLIFGVGIASGSAAILLGETNETPKPLCPRDCRTTGSVTGYGVRADGQSGPFKVPSDGHLVAWSVDLARPNDDQRDGFGGLFEDKKYGSDPVARIAVLKRKSKARMKLAKQSPVVDLVPHLGRRPIFTLDKPLKVKKGTVVGLTLPTWAPLFTDRVNAGGNIWAASRDPGNCGASGVTEAKPQLRKGTTRTYGCRLAGERLLYWAYFTPSGGKKGGGGGGKNGGDDNGQNNTVRIGPTA